MTRTGLHFYPWDVTLWRGSETRMRFTPAERYFYRELLDHCYTEGSIPDDIIVLAKIADIDLKDAEEMWPVVRTKFTKSGDRWEHPKANEVIRQAIEKTEKHKVAGSKGGKSKAKAMLEQTQSEALPVKESKVKESTLSLSKTERESSEPTGSARSLASLTASGDEIPTPAEVFHGDAKKMHVAPENLPQDAPEPTGAPPTTQKSPQRPAGLKNAHHAFAEDEVASDLTLTSPETPMMAAERAIKETLAYLMNNHQVNRRSRSENVMGALRKIAKEEHGRTIPALMSYIRSQHDRWKKCRDWREGFANGLVDWLLEGMWKHDAPPAGGAIAPSRPRLRYPEG